MRRLPATRHQLGSTLSQVHNFPAHGLTCHSPTGASRRQSCGTYVSILWRGCAILPHNRVAAQLPEPFSPSEMARQLQESDRNQDCAHADQGAPSDPVEPHGAISFVRGIELGGVYSCEANQDGVSSHRQIARGANLRPKKSAHRSGEFSSAISPSSPRPARPRTFSPNAPTAIFRRPSAGSRAAAEWGAMPSTPYSRTSSPKSGCRPGDQSEAA